MSERTTSVRYYEAVESFIEFARTLSDDEWAIRVPCTPEWTARDVLSHVSGIPDDALNGRMDDPASEQWTAAQVELNREFTVDQLLTRWAEQYELFGQAIESLGEQRPPYDCHSHEHDIRHALGRPGNRDSAIVDDAAPALLIGLAEVPVAITVELDDGSSRAVGQADSSLAATLSTTRFEIFRSRLGRRTVAQVRALDWSGDDVAIDAALAGWFNFGPSTITIDE